MKPIPADVVEKTWKKVGGMSPQDAPELIDRMTKQQPLILAYLMGIGGDLFNQDEREVFVYAGIVIWQIMSQGETPLPEVTEEMIDEAEESNEKMLDYLEDESEIGIEEAVKDLLDNYNQKEVLRYALETIMEEPEEGCLIRDKNKGMMMIYLKTVIDCFDR